MFYNLHVMYNDKSYWQDPENFRPERFLTEDGQLDKIRTGRIMNSLFGVGPRVCFGETLAIDAFFIFLAAMVINFEFDKAPGHELTLEMPHNKLVLAPQPYYLKLTPRC